MSHSKRNTSRAVFTSHERSMAKAAWNSTTARLNRDSFLPFGSCRLCLQPAVTPVSCSHGDIFCRECALSDILSQKKEIKRLEKTREKAAKEAAEDKEREELEASGRAIQEFEKIQMGLEAKLGGSSTSKKIIGREDGKVLVEEDVPGGKRGEKRKFELDEDELMRIAREERMKARKAIDDEKASKATLPSFWVPSVTPTSNTNAPLHTIIKKTKHSPVCPASSADKPHNYSLASLITLAFTEEKDASGKSQSICPSCKKALSNTSKATLANPCGHVLCKSCVAKFMTPTGVHDPHAPEVDQNVVMCYVCDAVLLKGHDPKSRKSGDASLPLVEIQCEGTGFASGGSNTVEKSGVAFQC